MKIFIHNVKCMNAVPSSGSNILKILFWPLVPSWGQNLFEKLQRPLKHFSISSVHQYLLLGMISNQFSNPKENASKLEKNSKLFWTYKKLHHLAPNLALFETNRMLYRSYGRDISHNWWQLRGPAPDIATVF